MTRKTPQPPLPTELHSKRTPPTPEQINAEQRRVAEKEHAARQANLPATLPGTPALPTMPALLSADDYFGRNPSRMVVGRPVRPNLKLGKWIYADDAADTPLPDDAEYAVLYDSTWCGWVRLEADTPPQYEGGLLFSEGFKRPSREELGDSDPAYWPISQFDNLPTDPWKEAAYQPLEQLPSGELLTIQIQSKPRSSAIFAIDGLLSHCRQLMRRDHESYPIIRLGIGNYESRKYGQQYKPIFRIVGKTPKAGIAKHDTSLKADLDDDLPFFTK